MCHKLNEQYAMLNEAQAFQHSTHLIELCIKENGLKNGDLRPFQGGDGARIHDIWISYKAVSHFLLHQVFETYIKLILRAEDVNVPYSHRLVTLHDLMSSDSKGWCRQRSVPRSRPRIRQT